MEQVDEETDYGKRAAGKDIVKPIARRTNQPRQAKNNTILEATCHTP